MNVVEGVGGAVMATVDGRPPQGPTLPRRRPQPRQHEAERAARREGVMREQPVVAGGDAEDAGHKGDDGDEHSGGADARHQGRQQHPVQQEQADNQTTLCRCGHARLLQLDDVRCHRC